MAHRVLAILCATCFWIAAATVVLAQEDWPALRDRMANLGTVCVAGDPRDDANFDVALQLFILGLTAEEGLFYSPSAISRLGLVYETVDCFFAAWRDDPELAELNAEARPHFHRAIHDWQQGGLEYANGSGGGAKNGGGSRGGLVILTPTRAFLPSHNFPPEGYRGYGLIAFPSRATASDIDRHRAICTAFYAAMEPTDEVSAAPADQFLTGWPVETEDVADALNAFGGTAEQACETAIEAYDLETAQRVLAVARQAGERLTGRGPFLLAWAPTDTFGIEDAFVLALDLSRVDNYDEAQVLMNEWKADITEDFEILANGFSLERMRVKIRRWADAYGEGYLSLLRGG